MSEAIRKAKVNVISMCYKTSAKLKNCKGSGEQAAWLIGILIAVVVGAILLAVFGDTVKETMSTIGDRIKEMFNYK